jgi:hypothetical protein
MLSPARLTQMLMEVIFLMLGLLVVWLGANGRIRFDRHSVPVLVVSLALVAWGALAFARPAHHLARWELRWEKWNRGASLVLLGLVLLAITRVPLLWVPKLLIAMGLILVLRGIFGSLLIFKQS